VIILETINIDKISGVGLKTKKILNKNGIYSTYDLVRFFPSSYEQFEVSNVSYKVHNQVITIKCEVLLKPIIVSSFKTTVTTFAVKSDYSEISVTAFNQPYLIDNLNIGDMIYIKGKYDFYQKKITANKIVKEDNFESIKPKYNIEGIYDTTISKLVKKVFHEEKVTIFETLPSSMIEKHKLLTRYQTFKILHSPLNKQDYQAAIKRLKYEEAYFLQKELALKINQRVIRNEKKYNNDKVKELISSIPYQLTNDQKAAVNDIFRDFKKKEAAYRLIQGDVGSGKTVVGMIAMYGVVTANEQATLMAPTELLAKQHYETIKHFLNPFGVRIILLTSETKDKKMSKEAIKNGEYDIIIGTHALITDDVSFKNLGLIIIDEQHKFGVLARNSLSKKAIEADLIYLTATPIPRTLTISLFGDASISVIKEKPLNRQIVTTELIMDYDLNRIYTEISTTLKRQERVYVVVPAIVSEHAKYNIDNVSKLLRENIANINLFTMHGKNSKVLQDEAMTNFMKSDNAVLLATTMIEVGIDVSDATLMIIFSANFFGLSQLHQLRGRVGRSDRLSRCLLVSTKEEVERLNILVTENDGFKLSEYDLKLRGPGDIIGQEQTGFINLKYLSFIDDYDILKKMREEVIKIS